MGPPARRHGIDRFWVAGCCERCGAQRSRYNREPLCAPCQAASRPVERPGPAPRATADVTLWPAPPLWLWATPQGQAVLCSGDLGAILRAYRAATGLTQDQLGTLLALDQSYVSRIERGSRSVRDLQALGHIADRLSVPLHALGLASTDGGDRAAFDEAISRAYRELEHAEAYSMVLNPFALREIHVRGLLRTGRPRHPGTRDGLKRRGRLAVRSFPTGSSGAFGAGRPARGA